MKPKVFVLLLQTTPRSKQTQYIIGKLDPDFSESDAPLYREWGVGKYFEETVRRVAELNRVQGGA